MIESRFEIKNLVNHTKEAFSRLPYKSALGRLLLLAGALPYSHFVSPSVKAAGPCVPPDITARHQFFLNNEVDSIKAGPNGEPEYEEGIDTLIGGLPNQETILRTIGAQPQTLRFTSNRSGIDGPKLLNPRRSDEVTIRDDKPYMQVRAEVTARIATQNGLKVDKTISQPFEIPCGTNFPINVFTAITAEEVNYLRSQRVEFGAPIHLRSGAKDVPRESSSVRVERPFSAPPAPTSTPTRVEAPPIGRPSDEAQPSGVDWRNALLCLTVPFAVAGGLLIAGGIWVRRRIEPIMRFIRVAGPAGRELTVIIEEWVRRRGGAP